jgi:hypothetical protein
MNKIPTVVFISSLSGAVLLAPAVGHGEDFSFVPRVTEGVMNYEFKQEGLLSFPSANSTSASREYTTTDWMPFVGGGVTAFWKRFFVDAYIQTTDTGTDSYQLARSATITNEQDSLSEVSTASLHGTPSSRFDRTDWSLSAGYGVTGNFAVFAGYKKSKTNFDDQGSTTMQFTLPLTLSGVPLEVPLTLSAQFKQNRNLTEDGPFVGATYGWPIGGVGVLSANAAVAFLSGTGTTSGRLTNLSIVNNPAALPLTADQLASVAASTGGPVQLGGDVIGLTLGLSWMGRITDRLGYSLGVNGYQYNFSSNKQAEPNFTERVINVSASLSYRF